MSIGRKVPEGTENQKVLSTASGFHSFLYAVCHVRDIQCNECKVELSAPHGMRCATVA